MPNKDDDHWLVRESTIRLLWIVSVAMLAILVFADVLVEHHAHFGIDGTFGFNAWFGFASCVALVLIARLLGRIFKRPDTYYDD
jgi:hypothetical protein